MNDNKWMTRAYIAASMSMDSRTKIGCVFVHKWHGDLNFVSANRPPANSRPASYEGTSLTKHDYMEHAERLAIYDIFRNAIDEGAESLDFSDYTVYVNETPCSDCMRAMVEVGIRDVRICDRWFNHCRTHGPDPNDKYEKSATIMTMAGGMVTRGAFELEEAVVARRDDLNFNPMDY